MSNISKYYGDFAANKDIELSVKKGSIHAVIGENGAGKSTLMNILSGVTIPTSGLIMLEGKVLHLNNPKDATRAGIGMVQQEFMLFEELTVIENIVFGAEDSNRLGILNLKKSEEKIKKICDQYHFEIPLHKKVSSLPIALQQQVEIVKVLYRDVDIIILDEPTAVLTPQGVEGLFEALRFLVKNGKTVIFITHKLKEVLAISDHITVLKSGQVVGHVMTRDVDEKMLARMMVGRDVFLELDRTPSDPSAKTIYEIDHLCVCDDKGFKVVDSLSFSLKKGEILGIVGVAGNGQSELIQTLFGLRKCVSGKIIYDGKDITNLHPKHYRDLKIGYVPQDRVLIGSSRESTLIENIMIGKHSGEFSHRGMIDYRAAGEFSKEVVERFDVRTTGLEMNASSLSGGNLQKLIVGREFSQDANLLIVEDPTRGIDIGSMEFIWKEIVKAVEEEKKSCLLLSYDLNEAMSLSDRILVLFKGCIVHEFLREEFDENEIGFYMLGGVKA